jgi:hypothetical protein
LLLSQFLKVSTSFGLLSLLGELSAGTHREHTRRTHMQLHTR